MFNHNLYMKYHWCKSMTLCQMLSVHKNVGSFHEYLRYCHKIATLSSAFKVPSRDPDFTLLAWFLPKLAYSRVLFILAMAGGQLKNK